MCRKIQNHIVPPLDKFNMSRTFLSPREVEEHYIKNYFLLRSNLSVSNYILYGLCKIGLPSLNRLVTNMLETCKRNPFDVINDAVLETV
jgi:hypothetical protein